MSSNRSPASLTSFAPGGESLPDATLLVPGGPDESADFLVIHEPVRLMLFGTDASEVAVEQVVGDTITRRTGPYASAGVQAKLSPTRTSLILDTAGRYRVVRSGGTDSFVVKFPLTMSHEPFQSLLTDGVIGLVDVMGEIATAINNSGGGSGGGGSVDGVTASLPLTSSGGSIPNIAIPKAAAAVNGYLSSVDWNTFNGKQAPATTLAGYGITDAYTKTQSDANYPTKTGGGATGTWPINITGIAEGSGTVSNPDPNEGLTISGANIGTVYNTTIADAVMSVAVGGAISLPASTWKTKNLVQVLDTILFPDQFPTYTVPTITCSSSITGTREVGETISPVITVVGSENDSGAFTALSVVRGVTVVNTNNAPSQGTLADIAAQFGYADPNNPNKSYTSAYTDTAFVVPSGSTTWNGRGAYSAGLPKKNNKGNNDTRTAAVRSNNAPQAADSAFNSATTSVTGLYPYFWGKSSTQPTAASIAAAIAAGTANKVLAASSVTVPVTYDAVSEFVWVAIPGTSTVKTKWYNTDLNQGSIGAGQFILAPVSQNVNSPESRWTAVPFNIYISGYATTTSGAIEYRNS